MELLGKFRKFMMIMHAPVVGFLLRKTSSGHVPQSRCPFMGVSENCGCLKVVILMLGPQIAQCKYNSIMYRLGASVLKASAAALALAARTCFSCSFHVRIVLACCGSCQRQNWP